VKSLIFVLSAIFSLTASASLRDCYRQVSQADKNECMMFEKDRAIGRFMKELTQKCAGNEEIKDSKGGTIHSMLLDECMINKLDDLAEAMKKD
jgi:hypothetical protein